MSKKNAINALQLSFAKRAIAVLCQKPEEIVFIKQLNVNFRIKFLKPTHLAVLFRHQILPQGGELDVEVKFR